MSFMLILSEIIVPFILFSIIAYGYASKVDVYNAFIEGAKEGMSTVVQIMPTIIGLMVAVGIIRSSGALDLFSSLLAPVVGLVGFPSEAIPLSFMRFISSSATLGLALDIFKNYGADSFLGRFVSVMMGCTETVFYTMSVYFMSVKIKDTRYTLSVAILSNIAGIIASFYITLKVFGR